MKYDSKVSTLEERDDLDSLTVDDLHGIFTAYEMRTRHNDSSRKEATFKAINESKKSEASRKFKKGKMGNKKKYFVKKKILYTMEDSEDKET